MSFADSIKAYRVKHTITEDDLRALFTIAGGEKTTRDKLVSEGSLR